MSLSKLRYLITNYRQMGHFINVQMSITWLSSFIMMHFVLQNQFCHANGSQNLCCPNSPFVRVSVKLI